MIYSKMFTDFRAFFASLIPKNFVEMVNAFILLPDFDKIAFTKGESTPPDKKEPIGTSDFT